VIISQKSVQLQTAGASSTRASVSALWGPKALEQVVDLELQFDVEREKISARRLKRFVFIHVFEADINQIL
jgi:DNA mismatch repair protein PMS2